MRPVNGSRQKRSATPLVWQCTFNDAEWQVKLVQHAVLEPEVPQVDIAFRSNRELEDIRELV